MARYSIHETLIKKLETRLTTIQHKCAKYGCDFYYERIGEEFKEVTDDQGRTFKAKYIVVEAEGLAIINDWRFVAVLEHKPEGNIIRQYDYNLEVPLKYRTTSPICEHCNTARSRKDTCLIYNDLTGEWKQVGKSCLKDFTNGLDADLVACLMSWRDGLEHTASLDGNWNKSSYRYYPVKPLLCYGYECVQHFGYVKADSYDRPTGWRSFEMYEYIELGRRHDPATDDAIEDAVKHHGFKADTKANRDAVETMMEWILSEDTSDSSYLHNLQTLVKSGCIISRDVPLLISLVPAYRRHIQQIEADKARAEKHEAEVAASEYIGNIKDKISVEIKSHEVLTTWDNQYGTTILYKFVDVNDNILIWASSVWVDPDKQVVKLTGTVKDHEEFRGVKQTVVTRCKVEYKPDEPKEEPKAAEPYDFSWMDID